MQRECRRVHYSGRVQGVGFRYNALNIARGFNVVGYVRNLPDGRVELVAEGLATELDSLFRAIRETMDRFIRDETIEPWPAPPDPPGEFTIRYD